jgi:D-arabinitol 2-dehydrogenase
MSAIRSALFRSMPLVSRRTTQTSLRAFSRPTAISADEKDEGASRAGYEKHRVGVEPKLAGMDENIKFTTPKVRISYMISPRFLQLCSR